MKKPVDKIAVIGMSVRLPGATDLKQYWHNLLNGIESVNHFSQEALEAAGIPTSLIQDPNYIPAKAILDDVYSFAAEYFKLNPHQAKLLDPQYRLLLECVGEAWEHAGHNVENYTGRVGVFATSSSQDNYLNEHLYHHSDYQGAENRYQLLIANARDFLATRIAYQYDFKGPAINVQTACSSSLVAVKYACDALRSGECDTAVVAAMSITFPTIAGYWHQPGMIFSADGHCRPFDKNASGIIPGNGGGVLLLKPLEDALYDNDTIYAVVSGAALNNDGHQKLSYTAPSIDGQRDVINHAADLAGIQPKDLSYIEAHGTGTVLGDHIEIAALTECLHGANSPIYLGSVKSNLGHLDVAAGFAGIVKAILSLHHGHIAPSINVDTPNPALLACDALNLAQRATPYPNRQNYAGVSAFGVGGTNAHIILSSYHPPTLLTGKKQHRSVTAVLPLSAETLAQLNSIKDDLAITLHETTHNLQNIAATLQLGRKQHTYRQAAICHDTKQAANAMYLPNDSALILSNYPQTDNALVLIPSYDQVTAAEALKTLPPLIPIFAEHIKNCEALLRAMGIKDRLDKASLLTVFAANYALIQCLEHWGVSTQKLIRTDRISTYLHHCHRGDISLKTALLMVKEEQQFQKQHSTPVTLLNIHASTEQLTALLAGHNYQTIRVNSPVSQSILVATEDAQKVTTTLRAHKIVSETVADRVLSQSALTLLGQYQQELYEKTNPTTQIDWVKLISEPIDIPKQLAQLSKQQVVALSLFDSTQVLRWLQQSANFSDNLTLTPIAYPDMPIDEMLHYQIAHLWVLLGDINWSHWRTSWQGKQDFSRVSLPAYPLKRQQYRIEPTKQQNHKLPAELKNKPNIDTSAYTYITQWHETTLPTEKAHQNAHTNKALINLDQPSKPDAMTDLTNALPGASIIKLQPGLEPPSQASLDAQVLQWQQYLDTIADQQDLLVIATTSSPHDATTYYQLLALAKAAALQSDRINIHILIGVLHSSSEEADTSIYTAMLTGVTQVLPLEAPPCRTLLVELIDTPASSLMNILHHMPLDSWQGTLRIEQGHYYRKHLTKQEPLKQAPRKLRRYGVYVITGGLGGIGLTLAQFMATHYQTNIVLMARRHVPPAHQWQEIITSGTASINEVEMLTALQAIQAQANQLLILPTDVSDEEQLLNALNIVEQRFGTINGIIHAASPMPGGLIANKSYAEVSSMINTKLKAATLLTDYTSQKNVEFLLLCSGLNTYLPEAGFTDYIAANAALDALAKLKKSQAPVISISWDTWHGTGMHHRYLHPELDNTKAYYPGHTWVLPLLEEHILDQHKILLGALMIDLACRTYGSSCPVTLEEISFSRTSTIGNIENYRLYLHCDTSGRGEINDGPSNIPMMRFLKTTHQGQQETISIVNLLQQFTTAKQIELDTNISTKQHRIQVGPHWQCIDWVRANPDEYLAKLKLPEIYQHEIALSLLHPSLLDVAYSYHIQFENELYLPFYIGKIKVFQPLEPVLYSHVTVVERNEKAGTLESDISVFNPQGKLLVKVQEFILKAASGVSASAAQKDQIHLGITAKEGVILFEQTLTSTEPCLVISKQSIDSITSQTKPSERCANRRRSTVAPSDTPVLDQLIALWQQILEVDAITADDDFFVLNGDSLSAIQLTYQIRKQLHITINPNELMSHSKFSDFCELVSQRLDDEN